MSLSLNIQLMMSRSRNATALLAFLTFITAGALATIVMGHRQHDEHAQQAGLAMMMRIERLLAHAQRTNLHVADLVGQSCQSALPMLRNAATKAAFVHSLKLLQQNRVYCASAMADANTPLPSLHSHVNAGTPLTLLPGSASHPHHPMLSLWTPTPRGAVISNIDNTHLTSLLSLDPPTNKTWLRIGERWLDNRGILHHSPPSQDSTAVISFQSATYPFTLILQSTTDISSWLGWVWQWRLTWGLWLVLSLSCTLALWRWLGQVPLLETELREGLNSGEFIPYVQPVLTAHNRQLCGLEVLMRWQRRDIGLVEPMKFIPQAETSGLIVPMTSQIMTQVAKLLAPMASRLPMPFHVAFNISAAHFRSNSLLSDCREFLHHFPSGTVGLTLEITEREWLANNHQTQTLLNELHHLGIQLALDDFGTGHSSLAYLKQFPVDIIKLDQMFVRKMGTEEVSRHLVNHVIELGHTLELSIIAEGVETESQAEYLTHQGVDQLQGYLFGRPQPLQEWVTVLECAA